MLKKQQSQGFALLEAIVIIVIIGVISGAGWFVWHGHQTTKSLAKTTTKTTAKAPAVAATPAKVAATPAATADQFIASNPVDLSQISQISKFRSCAGHDYSGNDTAGVAEANRSMKHYFEPTASLANSVGKLKIYAPFDGAVQSYEADQTPRGKKLTLSSTATKWNVVIFHVDLVAGLDTGSKITAGELIGYANLAGGADFDIALQEFPIDQSTFANMTQAERQQYMAAHGKMVESFDSLLNHLSPSIMALYTARGITTDNLILSAADRDASPCDFSNSSYNASDWVKLN